MKTLLPPLACLAFLAALSPAGAMSSDNSGYAIVLPFVVNAPSFNTQTQVFVENHSAAPVSLVAQYVGERTSANPLLLICSESNATPAPQTFVLTVPVDGVLRFNLRDLLEQKCRGSRPAGSIGDRGTLTLFANKGSSSVRISALARVEAIPGGAGFPAVGYSEPGLPLGALEGSTQIITGVQNGASGSVKLRTDCLIGSFYDAGGSGNLYRVTVKDSTGGVLGSTVISLAPWSAELLVDVFSAVGAGGMMVAGGRVEVEPAANSSNPAMVATCRVLGGSTTDYLMGKVYEPKDLLRQRRVSANSTPGRGNFIFVPGFGPALHAIFLRHPDLVQCSVDSSQLALEVVAPDGTVITGGFQSTGEFTTRERQSINHGVADAWILKVTENAANPPPMGSLPIPYRLTCVSGNGMSQIDKISG
ncbi:MAG TPA: hypothetical protein VGS22_01995 [Thermoanaerobaculia bacterium]|jgi:hypothetical protein|nr:hypothetical protein [Thermoanaerobaculia bacterium]